MGGPAGRAGDRDSRTRKCLVLLPFLFLGLSGGQEGRTDIAAIYYGRGGMGRGWKVLSIPPPPVSFILRLRLHRWHTTLGVPDHALSRGPGLFASRSFIACGGLWRVGTNSRETKYHLICNINRGRRCMLRVVLSCSKVFPRDVEGVGGCFPSGFAPPPPPGAKSNDVYNALPLSLPTFSFILSVA